MVKKSSWRENVADGWQAGEPDKTSDSKRDEEAGRNMGCQEKDDSKGGDKETGPEL